MLKHCTCLCVTSVNCRSLLTLLSVLFTFSKSFLAQPVISGHPVYMEANRTGQLHCFKNNISPERNLLWQVLDDAFTDRITFQSVTTRSTNEDGTVNISLTSSYNVMDELIDRVTIQCILSGSDADSYQPKATVKLLFPDGG